MSRIGIIAAAAFGLAACTQAPGTQPAQGITYGPVNVNQAPAFGVPFGTDPVLTSVMSASSFYADPRSRLAGRPALAAQVAAQYEFATVALREPRFIDFSPLTQIQMDAGRIALRDTLGIRQDAPSEAVITQLTQAAGALGRGDAAAAETAVTGGSFTRPAATVLATLQAMPEVPAAGRAASFAEQQFNRPGGSRYFTP
ncbi:hypothetical protein [Elioraea sp.]|uniref:hypothetical protein n=1 Tax=Elioraea sp. TaxID=2185103 RepID=UPI0025BACA46|nr:hypothetical protein [Elioraea sp.]